MYFKTSRYWPHFIAKGGNWWRFNCFLSTDDDEKLNDDGGVGAQHGSRQVDLISGCCCCFGCSLESHCWNRSVSQQTVRLRSKPGTLK